MNPTHEVLTTLTTGCDSERSGDPTGWQPVTAEPPVVDVLDRAFWLRNPHDAWTWCRANDPIHRDERSGIWCITKHADVQWGRAARPAVLVGFGVPAQPSRRASRT